MNSFTILDLPPEIITEIFTYLPWFDLTEACLVCRLWQKIGQQHKFATKRCLTFTHCNLNDETEPGKSLINTKNDYYRLKIGKSCYVTRNCAKLFEKLGETITNLELTGNLEWENGLLTKVLEQFPVLQYLEISMALSDQVNTKTFVETLLSRKFKHVTLHGLTQIFVEHFLNVTKERLSNKSETRTEFCLNFNCDFDSRGKFDALFDNLASIFPRHQILEFTVPFKLRALQMLSTVTLNFSCLRKLEITSPKSFEDLKKVCQLMPNLQELVLWRGCLDFQLFDVFDCLVNLEVLWIQSGLRFTQATDFCQALQPKPKMKVLDMELIEGQINEEGFERLIKAMPNLKHLTLNQSEIRDEHFCTICDNLPELEALEIDFGKITDSGMLRANLANLRKLKSIKFYGGYGITAVGFSNFSELYFPELVLLKLNYLPKIDTTAVENVVKACPNVEYLSLDGCSKIDDAAIDLITNKLKRLRQLDLYSCIKVTTSKAIDYLIQNCNRLQFLDLSALNIDEGEKQVLYQKITTLRYIYDYDDGIDKSKYFKGKALRKRELYCTALF